jgi:hypothetical protein
MNLHHLVTIGLFGGMIPMNCVPFGAIISLIHGISDVLIAASRIASHTNFKIATRVLFITQTGIFIFLRNFVIPAYTIACWQLARYPLNLSQFQSAPNIISIMLTVLCCMHVYWSIMFVKIIVRGLISG